MIGYVTLGTNDINRAGRFYDELLKELNASRVMDTDRFIAWAVSPGAPMLSIIKPFDGKPACVGNGVMIALLVESEEMVRLIHKKAMELGAVNEGDPGPRGGFYTGYFRDLDGNKLNAYFPG